MSKVDWSKAPADAQFYRLKQFRKYDDGCEYMWDRGKWQRVGFYPLELHRRDVEYLEMRPHSVEWNGEGLPPVGTVCEMYWAGCLHAEVEVIQYRRGANQVVFWNKDKDHVDVAATPTASFKPIKSDKDKWIDAARQAMRELAPYSSDPIPYLYDALKSGKLPTP